MHLPHRPITNVQTDRQMCRWTESQMTQAICYSYLLSTGMQSRCTMNMKFILVLTIQSKCILVSYYTKTFTSVSDSLIDNKMHHNLHMTSAVYLHDKLVCTGDQRESVAMIERLWDVLAECVASTTRWDAPTTAIIRIWPEKITDWTLIRATHMILIAHSGRLVWVSEWAEV